jgi:hypothetical protein
VKADGSVVQVADIFSGGGSSMPNGFTAFNGELYFVANDGISGFEPWKLDKPRTAHGFVTQRNPEIRRATRPDMA